MPIGGMRLGIGYLFSILRIYVPRLGFSIPSLGIENQALGRSYLLALLFFSIGFRDF